MMMMMMPLLTGYIIRLLANGSMEPPYIICLHCMEMMVKKNGLIHTPIYLLQQ